MAPTTELSALLGKRDDGCPNGYIRRGSYCYSAWSWYGRWIFAAVVVVLFIILFAVWACVNSRRRRRQGLRPMYGTGWMAPGPGGSAPYNNPGGYNPPPPAYGQQYPMQNQPTGTTFNPQDGYYGQHEGIQQPKNVYENGNPNNDIYAPPEGPPPGKVVR